MGILKVILGIIGFIIYLIIGYYAMLFTDFIFSKTLDVPRSFANDKFFDDNDIDETAPLFLFWPSIVFGTLLVLLIVAIERLLFSFLENAESKIYYFITGKKLPSKEQDNEIK